jgi:hypothetical protein
MTTAHARALSRLAGALLGAITLLAAGCSAAGGGGGPPASPAVAAHDAVAVSPSGRAIAGRAPAATGPISGRPGRGSRIAWAPSLPRCSYAAGTPAPGGTGAASEGQARISRVGAADLGGRAATLGPAPARCVRPAPAPAPAKCPRNPHLLLPCRKT